MGANIDLSTQAPPPKGACKIKSEISGGKFEKAPWASEKDVYWCLDGIFCRRLLSLFDLKVLTLMFLCWCFGWMLVVWVREVLVWPTVLGWCQSMLWRQIEVVGEICPTVAPYIRALDYEASWWVVLIINRSDFFHLFSFRFEIYFCPLTPVWHLLAFPGCVFHPPHTLGLCWSLKWRMFLVGNKWRCLFWKASLFVCVIWWENWNQ